MILKMHAVSAEVSTKHPGCAGMDSHAFDDSHALVSARIDWLRPVKLAIKLIVFVIILFALPAPISFLIMLLTAVYCMNKINRSYGHRGTPPGFVSNKQTMSVVSAGELSSGTSGYAEVNPATCLPMIEDSCLDVAGNMFGDDSMTSIDTSIDDGVSSNL